MSPSVVDFKDKFLFSNGLLIVKINCVYIIPRIEILIHRRPRKGYFMCSQLLVARQPDQKAPYDKVIHCFVTTNFL
jgi:hypothetical protein